MKYGLLIDMDRVIYSGETLIEGADKFIAGLLENKIPFTFMTNNSQRTRLEIAKKELLGHYAFKPDLIVSSVSEIEFPLKWWAV